MTATGQNFSLYIGDDAQPDFTISDKSGAPINLSAVADIEWIAYRRSLAAPDLSLKKSTGGIVFVTSGADGKFRVIIGHAASAALDFGWYFHSAVITDASGNITTVAVGRMAALNRGEL